MRVSARAPVGVWSRRGALGLLLAGVACDGPAAEPPPSQSASPAETKAAAPATSPTAADASASEAALLQPPGCPSFDGPTQLATAPKTGLSEASGLAASPTHAGHWWTHNDSGAGAVMHLLGPEGDRRLRLALRDARAVDWEDAAAVSDPASGRGLVYAADFGDNFRVRPRVQIYRFEEPTEIDQKRGLVDAEHVDLRYPDAPHNAEALLVDPRDLSVLIVTKEEDGRSRLFATADPFAPGRPRDEVVVLEDAGVRDYGEAMVRGANLVTAGDVRRDGGAVLLRTYTGACWFWVGEDQPLHEAIAGECCPVPLAPEPQGEAIAFRRDRDGYATISEGNGSPVWGFAPAAASNP